jgi:adenosylhomocysteine nucleosidase
MTESPQSPAIVTMPGGTTNLHQSAAGYRPVVNIGSPDPADEPPAAGPVTPWTAGVLTILAEETVAVVRALGLSEQKAGGLRCYEGQFIPHGPGSGGEPRHVAALQTLGKGENAATVACGFLRQRYNPGTVVSAGIAGAIRPGIRLGDVVVATRVVHYDLRKETPGGTQRRGEEFVSPAVTGRAVNAFFTGNDPPEFQVTDPAGVTRRVRVHCGPIGSGNAVIADRNADVLRHLASYNREILAVDMESAGVAQACHEQSAVSGEMHGWVTVRGISDKAGKRKNDDHHHIAAWHAAVILGKLLPYLP